MKVTEGQRTERRCQPSVHFLDVFHCDNPVSRLFVVVEGRIDLLRHANNGSRLIRQRAGDGDIMAEASVSSARYHCDVMVVAPSEAVGIPRRRLREHLCTEAVFSGAWARHLGQEIQALRPRSEFLSLNTVAARLDAWIAYHRALADQIGVSAHGPLS